MPILTQEFISSFPETKSATATRTADHSVWWEKISHDEDNIVAIFNAHAPHKLASAVDNLESAIISGVWHGWASLLPKHDVPQQVFDLDKSLRATGQGIVARTVFTYYYFLLNDVCQ